MYGYLNLSGIDDLAAFYLSVVQMVQASNSSMRCEPVPLSSGKRISSTLNYATKRVPFVTSWYPEAQNLFV